MKRALKFAVVSAVAVAFLASCAHNVSLGSAYVISNHAQPAVIELKNYSFNPNHVVILDTVSHRILRLTNAADRRHNFTLVDPRAQAVLSKTLDPSESITISVDSLTSGNYRFYCNRFLHRYRGMEGMLMID